MSARALVVAVLLGAGLACRTNDAPSPPPTPSVDAPPPPAPPPPAPQQALDAMDTRTPVPLLPMMANHQKESMRAHLEAVQQIAAAIRVKDFAVIVEAASRIGYSEPMGRMCRHMGAGAPGFTEAALRFHHTADTIGDAAKRRDLDGVVAALAETLATCTSCHATFKQEIVDEARWAQLTGHEGPRSSSH